MTWIRSISMFRAAAATIALALVLVLEGLALNPAAAHEIRPAIVTVTLDRSGAIELMIKTSLEAYIAGSGQDHSSTAPASQAASYDLLRAMAPEALRARFLPIAKDFVGALRLEFDGMPTSLSLVEVGIPAVGDLGIARISTVVLSGSAPANAEAVTWYAQTSLGETVIRIARAGEEVPFFSALQAPGEPTAPVPLEGAIDADGLASFAKFVWIGLQHIVPKGLDHILFVVGLFLLSPRLQALLPQVTSFTVAHTVTLALGIYGVVRVSPAIVEPLIAASIVFVAAENLFTDRLQRWRPVVIFGFGLLHGLGFAGVLEDVGLPSSQFVSALVGFNIGVELGQLVVISGCFLAIGMWFRHRDWYRRVITVPASAVIALVATFWFFERIA